MPSLPLTGSLFFDSELREVSYHIKDYETKIAAIDKTIARYREDKKD